MPGAVLRPAAFHGSIDAVTPQSVPSVSVTELPAGAVLLDVRENNEWTAGHAPEAVHIPMGEVHRRLDDLPEDDEVYVICRSGGRSAQVTAFLNSRGRRAVNVAGGMQAWASAGRGMVGEQPGVDPRVI